MFDERYFSDYGVPTNRGNTFDIWYKTNPQAILQFLQMQGVYFIGGTFIDVYDERCGHGSDTSKVWDLRSTLVDQAVNVLRQAGHEEMAKLVEGAGPGYAEAPICLLSHINAYETIPGLRHDTVHALREIRNALYVLRPARVAVRFVKDVMIPRLPVADLEEPHGP